jgi:ABC-type branched-subunit amino acid transport system ATPase component/sugar phosphate permease
MAAGLDDKTVTFTRRAPVPSDRESASGARRDEQVVTTAAQAPAQTTRQSAAVTVRDVLSALKPRVATAGHSPKPVVVLSLPGLFRESAEGLRRVTYPFVFVALGLTGQQVATLGTITALVMVASALVMSYIGDRLPRLGLIGVATALYAGTFFAFGYSQTFAMFVLFTLLSNLFGGLSVLGPANMSLLSDFYPPEVRGRAYAWSANLSLGLAVPLAFAAGFIATEVGVSGAFFVGGGVALVGAFSLLSLREPQRGRWDRIRLGATEEVASREVRRPSLVESLRIVQSVGTLRRICYANAWLSACGLVVAPAITVNAIRVTGTSFWIQAVMAAGTTVLGMVSFLIGGYVSDRYLNERPHLVLPVLGWIYIFNLSIFVVIGLVRVPWLIIVMTFVSALVGQIPTTGQQVLTSQVTPANVRTFGIAFPQLYGVLGLIVLLPFLYVLPHGLSTVFILAAILGVPGALLYLTAKVDVERDMQSARLAVLAEQQAADAAAAGTTKLLVARGVQVAYDGVQVLFGVDLDIDDGELVALLGTNGAGKSTLLRAFAGLAEPNGGAIYLAGRDTTHAPPHELAALGVVSMPGGKGVFPTMSVRDNLRAAGWSLAADEASVRIHAAMDFFPRLRERQDTAAGNLSGGEQQMLALAQAMVMKPRLLLVDELSLGLAPAVVEELLQALVRLHEAGTTIVLVEQSVDLALSVAKRAVFMEKGEVRFDGPAEELRRRPELLRSVYIKGTRGKGRTSVATRSRFVHATAGTTVLETLGLSVSYGGVHALKDAEINVTSGEIVGLIGPNGAGKTTLFDAICGFVPSTGVVRIAGRDVSLASPAERSALGLARSFQDARLFPALSVVENVLLALHRHAGLETTAALAALRLPQSRKAEAKLRAKAEAILESVGLIDDADKVPAELSTGMRRVLDLGCLMAAQPDVLLLDEPSSGIAQAEAEELAPLLDRVRRELGCGLLLIEHDMSLLTSVADRLVGMVLGETIVEGSVDSVTSDPRLVAAYLGTSERVLARSGSAQLGGATVTSPRVPEEQP